MSTLKKLQAARGQSLVEFTLAAPLFFAAFYAIVEFSHLFYVRVTVQHALDEAGRYTSLGQGQSASDPNARLANIKAKFCNNLLATGLSCSGLGGVNFTVTNNNNGVSEPGPGGSGALVTITATFTKPFFGGALRLLDPVFPTGVNMSLSTIYKSEPYTVVSGGSAP